MFLFPAPLTTFDWLSQVHLLCLLELCGSNLLCVLVASMDMIRSCYRYLRLLSQSLGLPNLHCLEVKLVLSLGWLSWGRKVGAPYFPRAPLPWALGLDSVHPVWSWPKHVFKKNTKFFFPWPRQRFDVYRKPEHYIHNGLEKQQPLSQAEPTIHAIVSLNTISSAFSTRYPFAFPPLTRWRPDHPRCGL